MRKGGPLLVVILMASAFAWEERGMDGAPTGRTVEPSDIFVSHRPAWQSHRIVTAPQDLGLVAAGTADTIRRLRREGAPLAQPGMLAELGVSIDDVLETLDLVARVAVEDRGQLYQRLQDPGWIADNFQGLKWVPDREAARGRDIELVEDEIRLTKYVVYSLEGSRRRTRRFNTALYGLPLDEADGQPGIRLKLTRMDVYAGAFERGGTYAGMAPPLVWLTRDGANQALLQGTIDVRIGDNASQLYNVFQNNGRAWDPKQRNLDLQPRFWYFRPVEGVLGVEETALRPEVAVAGDVYNIGLGKLVALEWPTESGPELRLVVLADTGGAFQPNLFQLDYLAGTFPSKKAYAAWAKDTPDRVPATILVRRP